MYAFERIAEDRIKEAMEQGAFDGLEGEGRPLPLEDSGVKLAPEVRMAYKIMKNAGILPVEIETLKEIERIEELLPGIDDKNEHVHYVRRLNALVDNFNIMRKAPITLEKNRYYVQKLGDRFIKKK